MGEIISPSTMLTVFSCMLCTIFDFIFLDCNSSSNMLLNRQPRRPLKTKPTFTSPYNEFCRKQRPLLKTGQPNAEREKLLAHMWWELSNAERVAYKQGLVQVRPDGSEGPGSGRGGARVWAPAPLGGGPAPLTKLSRAAYDNGSYQAALTLLQHAHSAPPPAQAAIVSAVPVPTGKSQKPKVSSLPLPWQELTHNDGRKYYYNPETQVILTLAPAPNPNPSPHPQPQPQPHP